MGLVGSLWNPELQARLQRICEHIARQGASDKPSATHSPAQFKRRRMGLIRDAIAAVLAEHREGMLMRDIRTAVAGRLDEPIPSSSIRSCLSREASSRSGAFERLGRGCYRLRSGVLMQRAWRLSRARVRVEVRDT